MHDLFISYSNQDKTIADAICARMEERGIRCWIAPRDVRAGKNYAGQLVRAIQQSQVFVLVLTDHANLSVHVLKEVEQAVRSGVTILPFRIGEVQLSDDLQYYLSNVHWLDALTPPVEAHIQKLVNTVQLLIKPSNPMPPSEPEAQQDQAEGQVAEKPAEQAARRKTAMSAKLIGLILAGMAVLASVVGIIYNYFDTPGEQKDAVYSVSFSPDGKTLASGSYDETVRLWRVSDGAPLRKLVRYSYHLDSIFSVAFSPDGQTIASGSGENIVRLWRVSDGALLHTLNGHTDKVLSVAFSPDGETLASASYDGTVRLWRISNGTLLNTMKVREDEVYSVAFSPDGETLASGYRDQKIRLWRVSDGAFLKMFEGHTDSIKSVAFSPDGATLASGAEDKTVRLWRVSDGALMNKLERHTDSVLSVAFSPDGETLASGSSDETVRLWRVSNGAWLHTLRHTSVVFSVAFSPDGQTLASGSYDPSVRLWRVSDGVFLNTLGGLTEDMERSVFSPDGATLASGSSDGTILLWKVPR